MLSRRHQPLARLASLGASLLLTPGLAHAQVARLTYTQPKTLQIIVPNAPAGNPTVKVRHYEHAWYINTNQIVPVDAAAAFSPNPQSAKNYDPFAYDWRDTRKGQAGLINVGVVPNKDGKFPGNPPLTPVDLNTVNVNAALNNQAFTVKAGPLNDNADATVTFQNVPVPVANANYTATFKVDGSVTKQAGILGYAFSGGAVVYTDVPAVLKRSRVAAGPNTVIGRLGSGIPQQSRTFDPISFTMLDSSGNALLTDEIEGVVTAANDDGLVQWGSDGTVLLQTGAEGLAGIHLNIDSLYVLPGEGGSLDFELTNGFVTESQATGSFAGISLPSVGAALSSYSLALGSAPLTVALNLDPFVTANTANIALEFSQGALITTSSAPEPGTAPLMLAGLAAACLISFRLRRRPCR